MLKEAGVRAGSVHTSVLTRAIQTADLALAACEQSSVPVRRSWRLNERHYGALQGKSRAAIRQGFGDEQFMRWRRSYRTAPPPICDADLAAQAADPRYARVPSELMPRTESLQDVQRRLLPYWYDAILPELLAAGTVLVVAHGNTLRALVKHLDSISDSAIADLNIPTGMPLRYDLDATTLRPTNPGGTYLDPEAAAEAAAAVANQGR